MSQDCRNASSAVALGANRALLCDPLFKVAFLHLTLNVDNFIGEQNSYLRADMKTSLNVCISVC